MSATSGGARCDVWLLAGTTEGRHICQRLLSEGLNVTFTVATGAGARLLEDFIAESPEMPGRLDARVGRLDESEMTALIAEAAPACVIDATHPYAVEVSKNARQVAALAALPYLRYERPAVVDPADPAIRFFSSDAVSVAQAAADCGSTVLLTTGSKLLAPYVNECRARGVSLLARVLDDPGAVRAARHCGLSDDEIIFFSPPEGGAALTVDLLRGRGIAAVVMKDSGDVGGTLAKLAVCREAGVPVFVLGRESQPDAGYGEAFADMGELVIAALRHLGPSSCMDPSVHSDLSGDMRPPRPLGSTIMVQGTASNVGKSVLVAGLLRLLRRRGLRVAPFKAQNMSLNSGVTADGGEIGRAQMLQAFAAGVEPTTAMNPVLLKPQGDVGSQVVVEGQTWKTLKATDFYKAKSELWPAVTRNLDRLRAEYEVVVIEGAGSPAEVNLRSTDIVNMAVALYAESPVLLVGDIDRGGVFAAVHGTLDLIAPEEKALVKGIVINKFRGDLELLRPGLDWLGEKTGIPVAGVVPWQPSMGLPEEDSLSGYALYGAAAEEDAAEEEAGNSTGDGRVRPVDVAVLRLPRVSNFTDLDALASDIRFRVRWISPEATADEPAPDLLILPGTKTTLDDLAHIRSTGADAWITRSAASGACVLGICGGYQMLGEHIEDPHGVEAGPGSRLEGLGLLPVGTVFGRIKSLTRDTGVLAADTRVSVDGYQIHMGQTSPVAGPDSDPRSASEPPPLFILSGGLPDGAIVSARGGRWVAGTYLHGVFDNPAFRDHLFASVLEGAGVIVGDSVRSHQVDLLDVALDRLAELLESTLDMELLASLIPGLSREAGAAASASAVTADVSGGSDHA